MPLCGQVLKSGVSLKDGGSFKVEQDLENRLQYLQKLVRFVVSEQTLALLIEDQIFKAFFESTNFKPQRLGLGKLK